ncbi:2-phosphosulfolactate phosphatase [Xylanibacillus composti]|uniref:Probable 2-phosphosulfolactate phosphatase n=1 Tax=Xylanibacillus composti TaxID=1572762 RepID=A0A8J4H6R4_9BACL|nr:2-phosphosulfolactate phosphatase [Xylanibacillus composti]MDT9726275.1 2-phosphosulfolactate phosphatase [Xylanibacillus composti]GIQ70696.1 putative 2-phosphosulfolactate phosphatase [Xylanibacillus composti]
MRVDVIATVNEARSDDFLHKTAIVIDVLRATSTIVTALEFGSDGVIPVETVGQAKALKSGREEELLGGERYGRKIAGFDLGNSPFEYMKEQVKGKKIILTTTNGTRAIQKSHKAQHILVGSLLNAASCARAAASFKRDIVIVCAGTQDQFSLEDGLCAGSLLEELLAHESSLEMGDFARAMLLAFKQCKGRLPEAILSAANAKRMVRQGWKADVLYCAKRNIYDIAPLLTNHVLESYRPPQMRQACSK